MAADPHVRGPEPPRRAAPSGHKHLPRAYVPKVVDPDVISGLVHSGLARDLVVAWIAERQLGLITAVQLHYAGVGRGSIEWRLANGSLHRVFRGVYLVGHAVPVAGALEFAAVLAVGDRTVVSHRSAAALWGFARRPVGLVEVTVAPRVRARSPTGHRAQERRLRGAPVHRAPARRGAVARDRHDRPGARPSDPRLGSRPPCESCSRTTTGSRRPVSRR